MGNSLEAFNVAGAWLGINNVEDFEITPKSKPVKKKPRAKKTPAKNVKRIATSSQQQPKKRKVQTEKEKREKSLENFKINLVAKLPKQNRDTHSLEQIAIEFLTVDNSKDFRNKVFEFLNLAQLFLDVETQRHFIYSLIRQCVFEKIDKSHAFEDFSSLEFDSIECLAIHSALFELMKEDKIMKSTVDNQYISSTKLITQ